MRPAPKYLRGGATLPRPLLWAMAGLSLTAGVIGFSMGRDVAEMSETEAISIYAAIYAAETGRPRTDCLAVPGTGDAWLIVRCGTGAARHVYSVARDGALLQGTRPPDV